MIETLIGLIFFVIIIGVSRWPRRPCSASFLSRSHFDTIHVLVILVGVFIRLYVAQMFLAAAGIRVPWPKSRIESHTRPTPPSDLLRLKWTRAAEPLVVGLEASSSYRSKDRGRLTFQPIRGIPSRNLGGMDPPRMAAFCVMQYFLVIPVVECSISAGSSSPTPKRFTRGETIHSCKACSGAGRNSAPGSSPIIHAPASRQSRMTGIRS